jgi:hypothetical protein
MVTLLLHAFASPRSLIGRFSWVLTPIGETLIHTSTPRKTIRPQMTYNFRVPPPASQTLFAAH